MKKTWMKLFSCQAIYKPSLWDWWPSGACPHSKSFEQWTANGLLAAASLSHGPTCRGITWWAFRRLRLQICQGNATTLNNLGLQGKEGSTFFKEPDKSTCSQVIAVSFVGIGSTNRHKSRPIQELNRNTALIQVQLPISSARRQNPPANGNWKQSRVCDLWLMSVTLVNYIHCFTNLQVK